MSIAIKFAEQATAFAAYRAANPKARRTRATAIVHNGARQTIYGCVCGSRHSTSTDWNGRNARHVGEWRASHEDCIVAAVAAMAVSL